MIIFYSLTSQALKQIARIDDVSLGPGRKVLTSTTWYTMDIKKKLDDLMNASFYQDCLAPPAWMITGAG